MKIYRKRVASSKVLASKKNFISFPLTSNKAKITHEFDYVFDADVRRQIADKLLERSIEEVKDYINPDNLIIQISRDPEYRGMTNLYIVIYLEVPLEIACSCTVDEDYEEYSIYLNQLHTFLESLNLSSDIVYWNAFYSPVFIEGSLDDAEKVEAKIFDALDTSYHYSTSTLFYSTSTLFYSPDVDIDELVSRFISYCKKSSRSKTNRWHKILKELENEVGINSIYEQTDAGAYIDNITQKVEDSLGIWSEPSIQGGRGSIIFRDKNTDDVILESDYGEYCNDIISIALESKSEKEFISKLKSYYDI